MATIGVYGASGYTGRLTAAELLRRGHDVVLSGRSHERLEAAARGLPAGARVEVVPAGVDDADALRAAFAPLDALVNCAGPFVKFGEPVVTAAVATGTPYVDTTGEQPWMKRVVDRFDGPARAAGIAVVPAMGFDYVPGDLLAAVTARELQPLSEVVVAYAMAGFGATRGTMRSALEMLGGPEVEWRDGGWAAASRFGALRERFAFPAPIGPSVVARYPGGEQVTLPQHLEADRVRVVITASTFAPVAALAPAVPALAPLGGLALRSPLRRVLDRAIGRLPEGPPEDERRGARFTLVCEATARDGRRARGVLRGTDVYGITAVIAAHGAGLLAEGGHGGAAGNGASTAGATASGATGAVGSVAPAVAFAPEPFLAELAPHGIAVEVDGRPVGEAATAPAP